MIQNLPDWVTAGTAITAVVGGLFGVYATTQSRLDVADERWANVVSVVEQIVEDQKTHNADHVILRERLTKEEVNLVHLRKGQDRIYSELTRLNEVLTAK